jgi:hypothetical protein
MARDDERKDRQAFAKRQLRDVFERLVADGDLQSVVDLDLGVTCRNGDRYVVDLQVQWPLRRADPLRHGMKRERANWLRSLRHHVLLVVAEPPGWAPGETRWNVLKQWLDDLDEHGDPAFLHASENVVWRRDAFSLDPYPRTSTHANLRPIRDRRDEAA